MLSKDLKQVCEHQAAGNQHDESDWCKLWVLTAAHLWSEYP
jgi:hypothetical protein